MPRRGTLAVRKDLRGIVARAQRVIRLGAEAVIRHTGIHPSETFMQVEPADFHLVVIDRLILTGRRRRNTGTRCRATVGRLWRRG